MNLTAKLLVCAVLSAALSFGSYRLGAQRVQAKWDKAGAAAIVAAAKTEVAQGKVTTKVVTQYLDRVKVVRERGADIIKEVPIYVPSDTRCTLPGRFRVLHNAAAAGELPDPARIADAPAVSAQTAATAVVDNYNTCHANAEQLTALQGWIRQQQIFPGLQVTP